MKKIILLSIVFVCNTFTMIEELKKTNEKAQFFNQEIKEIGKKILADIAHLSPKANLSQNNIQVGLQTTINYIGAAFMGTMFTFLTSQKDVIHPLKTLFLKNPLKCLETRLFFKMTPLKGIQGKNEIKQLHKKTLAIIILAFLYYSFKDTSNEPNSFTTNLR